MKIEKFRMHAARYVQIIRLKYDIRREYFTVAIPVIAAIVLLCVAVLIGHTFPAIGETRDEVDDARLAAFAELVAELGEVEDGMDVEQIEVPQKDEEIKNNLDHILVFAVLVAIIPYSVDMYIQKGLLKKREIAYSGFLFKLSELMRGGIDPIRGVIELSKTGLGAITGSIKGAASAMILGHSFTDAMNNMAAAQKSEIIKKYTALVVRASYAGGSVADIVFRTSEDMRTVIRIEQEKEGDLKQYTIIFYFAQGIIVMLMYVLSTSLLPMIEGAGMEVLLGDAGVADIDFRLGFFHMIIMNAFFGGLIIGQITEGHIKHGLKHSAVLMIVCYVASTALILPVPPAEGDITIEVLSGDGQEGITGVPLEYPIVFMVRDRDGDPAQDVQVSINILPGGSVDPDIVKTGPDGRATVNIVPGLTEGVYEIKAISGIVEETATAHVRFPERPIIVPPLDQTLEAGAFGVIVWNITDDNPDQFRVLRDGETVMGPAQLIDRPLLEGLYYQLRSIMGVAHLSSVNISVPITITTPGVWNYTIIASDTTGNTTSDEVMITIIDVTPPKVISNPIGYPGIGMWAKNGDIIRLNVTVIDEHSGVRDVIVNVSSINDTIRYLSLTRVAETDLFTADIMVNTVAPYRIREAIIIATDKAKNVNNTMSFSIDIRY